MSFEDEIFSRSYEQDGDFDESPFDGFYEISDSDEDFEDEGNFSAFDAHVNDVDFSNLLGDFKTRFQGAKKQIRRMQTNPQRTQNPQEFTLASNHAVLQGQNPQKISRVVTPRSRSVIVESGLTQMEPTQRAHPKRQIRQQQPVQKQQPKMTRRMSALRNIPGSVKDHPVNRKRTVLQGQDPKKIARVLVPKSRKVIVEGVSKFILDGGGKAEAIKKVGYYKGEKLRELVLIFNNDSAVDFNLEIFNPSMMLDYLFSTSLNLNDKVSVSNSPVSYSDVLYDILANPTFIANCKFVFTGPKVSEQMAIPLKVINKRIDGVESIQPMSIAMKMDTMQYANDIVFFDMTDSINAAFIPDGMQVLEYKVLAGNTVVMAFFYKQKSLKDMAFKEETTKDKNTLKR